VRTDLSQRTNQDWVAALRDRGDSARQALAQLERYLRKILAKTLKNRVVASGELDDLTQEALLQLVRYLPTYRGDAAFTTWASSVAVRVAFTELRRRGARERGRAAFAQVVRDVHGDPGPMTPAADTKVMCQQLMESLQHAITSRLTDRQRTAILAELRGLPTVSIAAEMGTNQNALYKLVHDARVRLKRALTEMGHTREVVRECLDGGGAR